MNNLKQKALGLDEFTGEFCQVFNEEFIPNLYNFFQNEETEKKLSKSSYRVNITLI